MGGQESHALGTPPCGNTAVASAHHLLQRSFRPGSADFSMSLGFSFCTPVGQVVSWAPESWVKTHGDSSFPAESCTSTRFTI